MQDKYHMTLEQNILFEEYLTSINKIENATERAIEIMAYIMRSQLFWDGNKRSAMLFANQLMIQNGICAKQNRNQWQGKLPKLPTKPGTNGNRRGL